MLVKSLIKLVPHSFITKAQSQYLKQLKGDLRYDEAVVLMDFSQNYTYVIQNEAQGSYWNQRGCSLHPFVIYVKEGDKLCALNHCVVSSSIMMYPLFMKHQNLHAII